MLVPLVLPLWAVGALAQSVGACSNYGTALSNGTCQCPPGFSSSSDCTVATCDNPLVPTQDRQLFSTVLSGNASAGCARQCSDGFDGPNCNVCSSDMACSSALADRNGATSSSSSSSGISLTDGLGEPVCSRSAWSWTEGFASCQVVNPTLQSVFSGATTLTIQKTVDPSQALSNAEGPGGTMTAQLWYAPSSGNTTIVEQFFCAADSCVQSNSTGSAAQTEQVDWTCQNLRCTCIPGTEFCGAPGAPLDLTTTINDLSATLSITCDAATGTECAFKQQTLRTLFGANGLALSGCQWGECVLPSTINSLASSLSGSTTSDGGSNDLSGGVIAGLAVLGGFVVALLILLGLGLVNQRRARRRLRAKEGFPAGAGAAGSAASYEGKDEVPPVHPSSPVGVHFSNLSYILPAGPSSWPLSLLSRAPKQDRTILSSLSASIPGGSFCAVLGPSGSGKTSLVDLLAGARKTGYRAGSIELVRGASQYAGGEAGAPLAVVEKEREAVRIGYVDQHDVLSETSTVREAIAFAAEMKLGEVSRAKKRARVFEVMTQLGLVDIADSYIGTVEGTGRWGISGGERRRVSIALELVAHPSILILDEPTSGLDSTSALRILTSLKALTVATPSRSATTVIVTIHQPSSQLWHKFDDVLVLAQGGGQLYWGKADEVSGWWEGKGVRCPDGWNPADFLLDLATSPPPDFLPLRPSIAPRKFSVVTPLEQPLGDSQLPRRRSSAIPTMLLRNDNLHAGVDRTPQATALTQVEALFLREGKNLIRDRTLLLMHNLVLPLVALFVGGMYYQVNESIGGFQSRVGALFFSGCLVAFASLSALSNFSRAKRLFIRERGRAYYHSLAWLATEVVLDIVPLRLIPTILLSVIV
ncbi:hypothetical protein Rhopal_006322-T1 [Rhodotorula paludigena]|uniref:ABC transporter domain-containing protein n=1 Tax=Rhodotorula paludigena TaxID=86838 RepID=A0AAV5GKX7_9BASI|nr:hypothetical protein Rhopal_006322-T1 [Rhodotorula paludigena]